MLKNSPCSTHFEKPTQYQQGFQKIFIRLAENRKHIGLPELTVRENEVLGLIATGIAVKQVAEQLKLSSHTVTKHLKNIYSKLHVSNRIEAMNKFNAK